VLYHFIGGFSSGSFYLPFKRVRVWAWESYWIVGGLFSWLIVPWLAAALTVPDFLDIIRATAGSTLGWTYLFGLLWGIGGMTFGLSLRYLGMSLGMSVVLGTCSIFGALVPLVYRDVVGAPDGEGLRAMLASSAGEWLMAGIAACVVGIAICGKAGMMKERALAAKGTAPEGNEFDLARGLAVALVSGALSACFSFGIQAGQPMAQAAVAHGHDPLFQNNVVFVVVLWGGLTTNLLWCLYLNWRNRTFGDYRDRSAPLLPNYLLSAAAGSIWFLQFFFYGMGASKLGNGASSWILHMSFIILVSNAWGLLLREWQGTGSRTRAVVLLGIAAILLSVALTGYGDAQLHAE